MIYLSMLNGGGNHGHQLFDLIGTLTIARIFGFKYVHSYNEYLNFSGIQLDQMNIRDLPTDISRVMITGNKHLRHCYSNFGELVSLEEKDYPNIINFELANELLSKRNWSLNDTYRFIENCPVGVPSFEFAKNIFEPIKEKYKDKDCFVVLDCLRGSSVRILPHQAFSWYEQNLLQENFFDSIVGELASKFESRWSDKTSYFQDDRLNISVHIGRGRDYIRKFKKTDTSECHHQFSTEYWINLIGDIQDSLKGEKFCINIYTEQLNSEEIVEAFSNKPNIKFHIGENRGQCDYNKIHDIFYHFISSDIHVCSNSGFSTAPGFFRNKGVMIYHTHHTFYGLKNARGFIETNSDGNFNKKLLRSYFSDENFEKKPKKIDLPKIKIKDTKFNLSLSKQKVKNLLCINTCDKHDHEVEILKKSEFFSNIISNSDFKILYIKRGGDYVERVDDNVKLPGKERYDLLHTKIYDMIKFCQANYEFKHLIKLDCNFLTYSSVGERTREKICGVGRVEKLIYKNKFAQYAGTNGRPFLKRDYYKWMQQRSESVKLSEPSWMADDINYYCGKAYKIGYDFAEYISTTDECYKIFLDHDSVDENGFRPFAIEDVMIGRMFKSFETNKVDE